MNYPAASGRGISGDLELKEGSSLVVYLFVVFDTLILHIVFQYFKVAILSHRIDVVAVSPELSSPEERLHLGMLFEHLSRGYAFYGSDHIGRLYTWNGLDEEMGMIAIETYFEELIFVAKA
jgi:hypothetical protein